MTIFIQHQYQKLSFFSIKVLSCAILLGYDTDLVFLWGKVGVHGYWFPFIALSNFVRHDYVVTRNLLYRVRLKEKETRMWANAQRDGRPM